MNRCVPNHLLCGLVILSLSLPGCTSEPGDSGRTNGDGTMTNGNGEKEEPRRGLDVQREPFGKTPDGQSVEKFLLSNDHGMVVSVITYGAIVTAVEVPDKEGNIASVTLGFDTLDGYTDSEHKDPYFGAICGRYSNRIALGKFTIGENEYTLATNNPPNHLHGGNVGFSDVVWHAREHDTGDDDSVAVQLNYVSPDGEEGYPGELKVTLTYTLDNENQLRLDYTATSDKSTPINLTSHIYWNLGGVGAAIEPDSASPDSQSPARTGDVLGHELTLHCDRYLPVGETLIPTGELKAVAEGPMDFTRPMTIGSRFSEVKGDDPQGGYDHCYVINGSGESPRPAARARDPKSGRVMEVLTTEPGVQLYTGNFLDGSPSAGGFGPQAAFCLECQHFPDSPNQPEFPNTVYGPGEVYKQTTVYRFSVEK